MHSVLIELLKSENSLDSWRSKATFKALQRLTLMNFKIKFQKAYLVDLAWIFDFWLKLFIVKVAIKTENSDFSKNIKNLMDNNLF